MVVLGLGQLHPRENTAHMLLDRSLGDPQPVRDASVRAALCHEREHFAFTLCELMKKVGTAACRDKFLHQRRVNDRPTCRDPADSLRELGHIGHPALEQVTDALTGGQQLHRLLDLGVRRQDQDAGSGELLADLPGRFKALGHVTGGHPDVDDGQVRALLADEAQQPGSIVSLADDVEPRSLEQAGYPLTEQGVIIRQDNALACFAHYVSSSTSRHHPVALSPPSGDGIVEYITG